MSEPTICPVCGEAVEGPWVRFHYAKPYTDPENPGHYVDGTRRSLEGNDEETEGMAPPAPERQKVRKELKSLLVPLEEDVRWAGIGYLRDQGYRAYNMEQGHRPDGGHTRVGRGVPDCYFQGHGVTGWIEWKRPEGKTAKEKQTDAQKDFERHELANGGVYLLMESVEQLRVWDLANRGKQLELKPGDVGGPLPNQGGGASFPLPG